MNNTQYKRNTVMFNMRAQFRNIRDNFNFNVFSNKLINGKRIDFIFHFTVNSQEYMIVIPDHYSNECYLIKDDFAVEELVSTVLAVLTLNPDGRNIHDREKRALFEEFSKSFKSSCDWFFKFRTPFPSSDVFKPQTLESK